MDKNNLTPPELFKLGESELIKEGAAAEKEKAGTLRGGSSGCLLDDGRVVGKCPRLAHLRFLGYGTSVEDDRRIMFAGGVQNEVVWEQRLRAAGVSFKQEEEVPITYYTNNGTLVTGRGDVILHDSAGRPVRGQEHKKVSSPFTAYNVLAKQTPTLDHLIQATFYSFSLDIPFDIVYTSYTDYGLGFPNMRKTWDTVPDRYFNDGRYKLKPFIHWFTVGISAEDESYPVIVKNKYLPATRTVVSVKGIKDYYNFVSEIPESKDLGPRPAPIDSYGDKTSWNKCTGCPLKETCDTYENDYDLWLDKAKYELSKETV